MTGLPATGQPPAAIAAHLATELTDLRAHRASLDHEAIALDRERAATRALFDPARDATLARRYEAAAERSFFRSLREIERRAAVATPAEVPPAPVVTRPVASPVLPPVVPTMACPIEPRPVVNPTTVAPASRPQPATIEAIAANLGSFGSLTPDLPIAVGITPRPTLDPARHRPKLDGKAGRKGRRGSRSR